ncbi:UDP-N-acetylmuramoyl-tripeptide--D-alanyl-D-alanine ligase [Maritalea sp.]|uniref:UDP-N-acetylmuramoyl-tripeptide--D-alanyl-D- alanine ligase n=1 Tax=Maritalea sp. TaxID=2003361 RepID=UPI003EF8C37E
MPLWTLDQILAATGGKARFCTATEFTGVSIDSRDISENDLFVAIKGDRFDGHQFVDLAVKNGAGAALVSAQWADSNSVELPLVIVNDPLIALEKLGIAARARTKAKIVAITGSVGKTSTKEAVRLVLEGAGRTHASIKSFNNHWGVPLMLARMPQGTEFGVFEVGMNHSNEIRPLVKMIRPHMAIITNIGEVHLEHFDDIYGIVDAKAEIFEGLEPNGHVVLGADHPYLEAIETRANEIGFKDIQTFGKSEHADVCVQNVSHQQDGLVAEITLDGAKLSVSVPQFGEHALINAAAAIAVASSFGVDAGTIVNGLRKFTAPVGRGSVSKLKLADGEIIFLDESFNANPLSMRAALAVFARRTAVGSKIAVLGDMLELGERSQEFHEDLTDAVLTAQADRIILVGPLMAHLQAKIGEKLNVTHLNDTADLTDLLNETLAPGDVLMIKGSKGIGLGPIAADLHQRFSER